MEDLLLHNVGRIDRIIRLVLGVGLLGLYGALDPPLKYFTLLGLVLVATAFSGFCPLYRLLGLSTCARPGDGR
jgi:hypothetical protein